MNKPETLKFGKILARELVDGIVASCVRRGQSPSERLRQLRNKQHKIRTESVGSDRQLIFARFILYEIDIRLNNI